jgi:hypothetical protein
MTFAEWWAQLPQAMRRGDKARARTRYDAIQKRGEGKLLTLAYDAYIADCRANPWRGYLYASTFLGRWEEYIPVASGTGNGEHALGPGEHICRVCAPQHFWKHVGNCDLACLGETYFTCPEQREAMRRAIKAETRQAKAGGLFSE